MNKDELLVGIEVNYLKSTSKQNELLAIFMESFLISLAK